MIDELLKILWELISCKFDCSSKNNIELINYLKKKFDTAEEIAEIKNSNGFKNLVIGINTKLSNVNNALILSGHMDTIRPNESWGNNEKISDKAIFGLGACDMKAFIAEIIYQLNYLKKQTFPIIVVLTCDEETTVEGIQNVLTFLKNRNVNGKLTIIGEPTESKICANHKGMVDIVVRVIGKECHSATPRKGINAIYIASKFAQGIEELNKKYEPRKTSLNISKINGGVSGNSVAQNCNLYMDFRPFNNFHHNQIIKKIIYLKEMLEKQYRGCKINLEMKYDLPCFQKIESKIVNQICDKLNEKTIAFSAWSEAGYISEVCQNIIIFGAGNIEFAHKQDEQVSFEQLEKYDKKFINILEMLNKTSKF